MEQKMYRGKMAGASAGPHADRASGPQGEATGKEMGRQGPSPGRIHAPWGKYKFGKSHLMRQLCLDIVTEDHFSM